MNIDSITLIYFSPTRTTRKVLEGITQGFQTDSIDRLDLSRPEETTACEGHIPGRLAIIGVPVYGGRVPLEAVAGIQKIHTEKTPAVIVVVYGNREYEDALLELKDISVASGFIPVAGGAFIGEHSFSSEDTPIAMGRPDEKDLKKAAAFGESIQARLKKVQPLAVLPSLHVPGNFPYRKRWDPPKISPVTRTKPCTLCGTCAAVCPTQAIGVNAAVETDPDACILCCACIKNCPTGARVMEDPQIKDIAEWLNTNFQVRKVPETYEHI